MKNRDESTLRMIANAERAFTPWNEKCMDMLRIVAGDLSTFLVTPSSDVNSPAMRQVGSKRIYSELFRQDVVEGLSNPAAQDVLTLYKASSFKFPTIDVKGVNADSEWFHREYFRKRLNEKTDGLFQMRLQLLDHLICGRGVIGISFVECVPSLVHYPPFDVLYDLSAESVDNCRWVSVKSRQPMWAWVDMFGKKAFPDADHDSDDPYELEWYWDLGFGKSKPSKQYILDRNSGGEGAVIEVSDNPFTRLDVEEEVPMLPVHMTTLYQLPRMTWPMGCVELALPHYIALWKTDAYIGQIINQSPKYMAVDIDNIDESQRDQLARGDRIALLFKKSAGAVMETTDTLEIPASVYGYRAQNRSDALSIVGADPFATGNTIPDANFASEIQAQNARSGLTTDWVSKDHVAAWEAVIAKFMHVARKYDSRPLELRYGTDITIRFGLDEPAGPPALHLRPDAEICVRENTTKYLAKSADKQERLGDLQVLAPFAGQFPVAFKEAMRRYLDALDIPGTDEWLEPPLQAVMQPDPAAQSAAPQSSLPA